MDIRTPWKLVPWESWNVWNEVREAIFSSSPTRVSAALNKIAAWRTRSSLPVAVEVTGDLISIQRTDPCFSASTAAESSLTNEMLCLMYAMAIMRLINGVVDQSKKQSTSSVATRAEAAGLPRMLVDIRHEVAHQELPSLSYLQLASKQALEWLKVHYWEAQKQFLDDTQKRLQAKLHLYASQSETSQNKSPMRVRGGQKLVAHRAKKLVALSSPVVNLFGDCNDTVDIDTTNATRTNVVPHNLDVVICNDEVIDVEFQKSQRALSSAKKRLRSFYKSNHTILFSRGCSDCDVPINTVDNVPINTVDSVVAKCNSMTTSEKIAKGHVKDKPPLKDSWTISNDWRPCAIGMLPSKIHSAGVLPLFNSRLSSPAREASCQATAQGKSPESEVKAGVLSKETSGFVEMEIANTQSDPTWEKSSFVEIETNESTAMEIANTQSDPTREKRSYVEIETKESTLKRLKADTETRQTSGKQEDSYKIEAGHSDVLREEEREAGQNGSLLHERHKAPLLGGFLLLHGLYQRCGADQVAAIRSSIQVLK